MSINYYYEGMNAGNAARAKVFVSCGQSDKNQELEVACKIGAILDDLGFDYYIAKKEQTLQGVRDNIFRQLSESEYLLFVDFPREKLEGGNQSRGSLFSNQELALASYLEMDVLAFQHSDVIGLDGILEFIQGNCFPFYTNEELLLLVKNKIQERKNSGEWSSSWKKKLTLQAFGDYKDAHANGPQLRPSRWYHIRVHNNHRIKIAKNCVAYLEGLPEANDKPAPSELVEFKWKGINAQSVAIPPMQHRKLDAFQLYIDQPQSVILGINPFMVDFSGYKHDYTIRGPGRFRLHYVVYSDNFPPARATFELQIGQTVGDIALTNIPS